MTQIAQISPKPQKSKAEKNGIEGLIRAMLRKHRTPFMLLKKCVLEKQYTRFRKCLPEVTPYYAIKANPHPGVIKEFVRHGASFDVASAAEMLRSSYMARRNLSLASTIQPSISSTQGTSFSTACCATSLPHRP